MHVLLYIAAWIAVTEYGTLWLNCEYLGPMSVQMRFELLPSLQ